MKVGNNIKKFIQAEQDRLKHEIGYKIPIGQIKETIGKKCGTSYHNIEQMYKGYSQPKIGLALKLAEYFDVPVEELFFLEDE